MNKPKQNRERKVYVLLDFYLKENLFEIKPEEYIKIIMSHDTNLSRLKELLKLCKGKRPIYSVYLNNAEGKHLYGHTSLYMLVREYEKEGHKVIRIYTDSGRQTIYGEDYI